MRKDLGISRLCNFWKPANPPETLWNLEPLHRAVTQKTLRLRCRMEVVRWVELPFAVQRVLSTRTRRKPLDGVPFEPVRLKLRYP